MTIALTQGPLDPIDIPEAMGDVPPSNLEGLVRGTVDDLDGADARIGGNLDTMAPHLAGPGDDDPGPEIDEATGAHVAQATQPDPSFTPEADAAAQGSSQLASFANTLPPDPDRANTLHIDEGGTEFDAVEVVYADTVARFDAIDAKLDTLLAAIGAIQAGGGGGGGGGGGRDAARAKCYADALKAGIPQADLDAFLRNNPGDECRAIDALLS